MTALSRTSDESLYETDARFGISAPPGAATYPYSPGSESMAPQLCPTETSFEGTHLARLNNNSASPVLPAGRGNDDLIARPCESRSYSIFCPTRDGSTVGVSTPSRVARVVNASMTA